jgi:hypothetical protein
VLIVPAALDKGSLEAVQAVLDAFHTQTDAPFALQTQLGVIDECFSGYSLQDVFSRLKAKNTGTCAFGSASLSFLCLRVDHQDH